MSKRFVFVIFVFLAVNKTNAQTMDDYTDQLFFGVFSLNLHPNVKEFIERYVPLMVKKPAKDSGTWTSYPPIKEFPYTTIVNSYVFYSHPSINTPFKLGQLAITQKIYSDPKWLTNFTDIQLWFEFENEKDAKVFFETITGKYTTLATLKEIDSNNNINTAKFTNSKSENYYRSVQIKLAKDFFCGKKYAKPIKNSLKTVVEPGYKILITIGNDL